MVEKECDDLKLKEACDVVEFLIEIVKGPGKMKILKAINKNTKSNNRPTFGDIVKEDKDNLNELVKLGLVKEARSNAYGSDTSYYSLTEMSKELFGLNEKEGED